MRSEAGRPAAAARNRSPREARDPALQALRPGCEELAVRIRRQLPAVVGRRAPKEPEARPREPKIATVERREASVPRHKRVHARLDALWDARRLASAWYAASWRASRVFRRAPERLSALRPPPASGWRSKVANPGRRHAPRERGGVCVLAIRETGDGRFRICRKTGKYRDRAS